MAFPTTPVLDPCNRVENPLSNGGKWTNPYDTGGGNLQCDGTTAFSVSGYGSAYWNVAQFTDVEAYINPPSYPSSDNYLIVRGAAVGSNPNQYSINWASTGVGNIVLRKVVSGTATPLGTYDVSGMVTGLAIDHTHQIGISAVGTRISAWLDGVEVGFVTDSTFTTAGWIAFITSALTPSGFSNFGGGAPGSIGRPIKVINQAVNRAASF